MSQITIFYGAGPSAGSAGSPMLHKPCFISLRTQITGGALLLLIAWLVTQGLWLYPEPGNEFSLAVSASCAPDRMAQAAKGGRQYLYPGHQRRA